MEFLAIKSEEGKGVYIFNSKKEKNDILKKYQGCSHRIFNEAEKDIALEWAGVNDVFNREQKVVEVPLEKNISGSFMPDFISALEGLKNDGYHLAKIKLIDGTSFFLILGDFLYLRRSALLYVGYNTRDNRMCYSESIQSNYHNFNYLKENLNSSINTIQKAYKLDVPYMDSLRECLKLLKSWYGYGENKTIQLLKRPQIEVYGTLIKISHTFNNYSEISSPAPYSGRECYYSFVEENPKDTMIFNINNILTVEPFIIGKVVTDNQWIEVINKLVDEKVLTIV